MADKVSELLVCFEAGISQANRLFEPLGEIVPGVRVRIVLVQVPHGEDFNVVDQFLQVVPKPQPQRSVPSLDRRLQRFQVLLSRGQGLGSGLQLA